MLGGRSVAAAVLSAAVPPVTRLTEGESTESLSVAFLSYQSSPRQCPCGCCSLPSTRVMSLCANTPPLVCVRLVGVRTAASLPDCRLLLPVSGREAGSTLEWPRAVHALGGPEVSGSFQMSGGGGLSDFAVT